MASVGSAPRREQQGMKVNTGMMEVKVSSKGSMSNISDRQRNSIYSGQM